MACEARKAKFKVVVVLLCCMVAGLMIYTYRPLGIGCPSELDDVVFHDFISQMGYPIAYSLFAPSQRAIEEEQQRINDMEKRVSRLKDPCVKRLYKQHLW